MPNTYKDILHLGKYCYTLSTYAAAAAKSCPTLCDPTDGSPTLCLLALTFSKEIK